MFQTMLEYTSHLYLEIHGNKRVVEHSNVKIKPHRQSTKRLITKTDGFGRRVEPFQGVLLKK